MFAENLKKELKIISDTLSSIDVSLQMLAAKDTGTPTMLVGKKIVAQRLGVPAIAVDKLIHQGVASRGKSGLIEGRHYCKLDPDENNPSKFLYNANEILQSAWSNFIYD